MIGFILIAFLIALIIGMVLGWALCNWWNETIMGKAGGLFT